MVTDSCGVGADGATLSVMAWPRMAKSANAFTICRSGDLDLEVDLELCAIAEVVVGCEMKLMDTEARERRMESC